MEAQGQFEFEVSNGEATVVRFGGEDLQAEIVRVPERLGGVPVVAIAANAFEGALATEIRLPGTLRTLASYAFAGCSNLREVVVPANIGGVGCYLFGNDTHEVARAVVFQGETLSRAAIETAGDLGDGVVWHYQANGVDAWLRVKVDAISA